MKFTLRIPGRDAIESAPAANSANPLILSSVDGGAAGAAADDDVPVASEQAPISGLAGLATQAICEPDDEAKVERSTCADCQHLLRRGTCAEPEGAGLIPVGAGFGLAWPPAGYAETCASYSSKLTTPADLEQFMARMAADDPDDAQHLEVVRDMERESKGSSDEQS